MRISRLVAAVGFLLLVPGSYVLADLGATRFGLYPFAAVPVVFGVVFLLGVSVTFVALSYLRSREGDYAPARQ